MRRGTYPGKRDSTTPNFLRHRVVVPIYAPHLDGYFEHALDILDLVLESLRTSCEGRASVTLIANGSCEQVLQRLRAETDRGWVDQLVTNSVNRGKVDALRSALHGSFEPFVTVSDGDVLFHQGWLEAVDEVFHAFPEAASVAPSPNPAAAWSHPLAVVDGFFRGELALRPVVSAKDLERFADSLESPGFYGDDHFAAQLSVRRGGVVACVGSGHFCVTLRRECVGAIPRQPTLAALGQYSEHSTIDDPPEVVGGWKLATTRAWVRHLGNIPEPWMSEELETLCAERSSPAQRPLGKPAPFRPSSARWIPPLLRRTLAQAIRKRLTARAPHTSSGDLNATT